MIACGLFTGAGVRLVLAVVEEARSVALEAASPYVAMGYEVREDYWSGDMPSGAQRVVKHQLFRGNEYWFWGGTSFPDCEVNVEVYDGEGNPVSLETFSAEGKAGARVLPSRTGAYMIRISVVSQGGDEKPDWALVYGYR